MPRRIGENCSDFNYGWLRKQLRRFGWTYPILVDETDQIIAGHGRYEAAILLGLQEVPVSVVAGLNETEKRALALADNKIAANAGWDRKLLAAELGELASLLPECNLDIKITGFAAPEIDLVCTENLHPDVMVMKSAKDRV